jgi:tRNA A-37 threonylcarbamoyl transferase component Bud32
MIELTQDNAAGYLRGKGLIPEGVTPGVSSLGGGISNTVIKVTLPRDCFVVKQSLPSLRVQEDWPFDRSRIFVERDCMALLGELLPEGCVPSVKFSDDENYIFGMSCAPAGGVLWKELLLSGRIDQTSARRVGALLAEMHNKTAANSIAQSHFSEQTGFIQGRIDPYHRSTARAHPDLAAIIEEEVGRILGTRLALVHGDYSPKNMFMYPDHVLMLDFEVAHYGDPAFDIAFCLTHLILKAVKFPKWSPRYLLAARTFWHSYAAHQSPSLNFRVEHSTIRELGCLLLARIDGKSKIEYINDEPSRQLVRHIARRILLGNDNSIDLLIISIKEYLLRFLD